MFRTRQPFEYIFVVKVRRSEAIIAEGHGQREGEHQYQIPEDCPVSVPLELGHLEAILAQIECQLGVHPCIDDESKNAIRIPQGGTLMKELVA